MTDLLDLLAQATSSAPAQPSAGDFLRSPFVPLLLVIVVFWFIMARGRRKEQQKYEQMLNSLSRNDRVQTIGGIIGTVVDVRDDEVVLKVDETTNTKMRFNRSAIKGVIQESSSES